MTADLHRLRVRDVKLRASFPWQPWSEVGEMVQVCYGFVHGIMVSSIFAANLPEPTLNYLPFSGSDVLKFCCL